MPEQVRIPARGDGFSLFGELFLPEGEPRAVVLVAGAMAVRCRFYAQFAQFLSEQGAAALTFDYRGIGGSRPPGALKKFHATFHDWGEKDLGGAVDFLTGRFPGKPLKWVGHSAGGQLLGLVENAPVQASLFVAAQSGYWKNWSGIGRLVMASLWYAVIPASTALKGYLPMRAFRQGDDVPAGVAREWAQWGRQPHYVYSYAERQGGLAFRRYAGPIRSLAIADDSYAPKKAVEKLLEMYSAALWELPVVEKRPVGHFGWFKQPLLLPDEVAWLLAAT